MFVEAGKFVRRQTSGSKHSHYEGSWESLADLVEAHELKIDSSLYGTRTANRVPSPKLIIYSVLWGEC